MPAIQRRLHLLPTFTPARAAALSLSLALAATLLGGCTTPPPVPEPVPGVLGSTEQARPTPVPDATATATAAAAAAAAPPPLDPAAVAAAAARETAVADGRAGLRAAEEAYARNDWVGAAREFKALTTVYPRNGQVWFGLGASSALSGNLEEASAAFETALRIDPRDARAAYNLSLIRMSQAEVALGTASANRAQAAPQVQAEIAQLSRDLAPIFRRSAEAQPAPMAPAAAAAANVFRAQDPARQVPPSQAAGGMFNTTPLIPADIAR